MSPLSRRRPALRRPAFVLATLALLLLAPCRHASADPALEAPSLGRVFFAPAERHALEQQRARAAGEGGAQHFNGFVSGAGQVHAWIDGHAQAVPGTGARRTQPGAAPAGDVAFDARAGELMVRSGNGAVHRLRAGESDADEEGAALRPVAAARK